MEVYDTIMIEKRVSTLEAQHEFMKESIKEIKEGVDEIRDNHLWHLQRWIIGILVAVVMTLAGVVIDILIRLI